MTIHSSTDRHRNPKPVPPAYQERRIIDRIRTRRYSADETPYRPVGS